jgi:hypothetical protein
MGRNINCLKLLVLRHPYLFVLFCIPILGCAPTIRWKYEFRDVAKTATLEFSNPRINIVYEGVSLGTVSSTGSLQINGQGVEKGEGIFGEKGEGKYGEITFNRTYANGVATIEINGHAISIRERGTIINIDKQDFDVPQEGTLTLVVDQSGKVVKGQLKK